MYGRGVLHYVVKVRFIVIRLKFMLYFNRWWICFKNNYTFIYPLEKKKVNRKRFCLPKSNFYIIYRNHNKWILIIKHIVQPKYLCFTIVPTF